MKDFFINIINKLNSLISNMRKDLIVHCAVSTMIFTFIFNLSMLWCNASTAMIWATFATLVIGTIKEYLVDWLIRKQYVDEHDLWADLIGTITGILLFIPVLFV